ncbi:hypothetical protein [Dechloromonas denitrificans]|uniref:hypothetical protein n=1 Tax=Dechloromonas denitrificans TaxID=281362 RepID=UPI001CFA573C|nr:hypothetical protein [Dechloromonas denitrificans]UCV08558.1 hypothetical protein KI615_03230 [Dechloromonas denitrificans]
MEEPLISFARKLAADLSEHRLPNLENELSKVFRRLSEEEQLEIILLLMKKNVRAAAAIATRGHFPVGHQQLLLQIVLDSGETNAIKVMVRDVFARRMSANVFARCLRRNMSQLPKSVHFAAYYFLGAKKTDPKTYAMLQKLHEETRP